MLRRVIVGAGILAMTLGCGNLGGSSGDDDGMPDGPDAAPPPDAPPNAFIITGPIDNQFRLPGYGAVLWTVTIGAASLHSYGGGGSQDGLNFSIHTPGFIPPMALNGGTTGVAFFGLLPPGEEIPEGEVFNTSSRNDFIGVSRDYAIIYRGAPNVTQFTWETDFPVGFSCAACMRAGIGVDNDTLFPVDCSEVVINGGNFTDNPICNIF